MIYKRMGRLGKRKQGSALIIVMLLGIILGITTIGISQLSQIEFEGSTQTEEGDVALMAAKGGLEHGSLLWRYNHDIQMPYFAAADISADPGDIVCNKWNSGNTASKRNSLTEQATPSSKTQLYTRINLTQNKVSKVFNIACSNDTAYLDSRNANVKEGDTYYDLKIYYMDTMIGNPPADISLISALMSQDNTGNKYFANADGSENYFKMLTDKTHLKDTDGGMAARKLAKDESIYLFFPADTKIDTINLFWSGADPDDKRKCDVAEQANHWVNGDLETEPFEYALKYTDYKRSADGKIGAVYNDALLIKQGQTVATQEDFALRTSHAPVQLPLEPGDDPSQLHHYSQLIPTQKSAIKLTAMCKDIYFAVNVCKGPNSDCQSGTLPNSPNSASMKFDTGITTIEAIGHFGRTQRLIQKRINRSADKPTEPFSNAIFSTNPDNINAIIEVK